MLLLLIKETLTKKKFLILINIFIPIFVTVYYTISKTFNGIHK